MLVKEVIQDTDWYPARRSPSRPRISVLLPTFRRGRDGLFMRAARSILSQTIDDIELIIIDDASTDGTKDQIKTLMEQDSRVACLAHRNNIGLPAISEYEAYIKAKGDRIAFGFDDFVFESDALAALDEHIGKDGCEVVHGGAYIKDQLGNETILGAGLIGHDFLLTVNSIGNSSVLLSRDIVEDVGLYDPHLILARLCDWDLWRRIHKKYEIKVIPNIIGREHGLSRSDSLGNTYPLRYEVVQEFMAQDRDELLKPANFENRNFVSVDERSSVALQQSSDSAKSFYTTKPWYSKLSKNEKSVTINDINCRKIVSVYGNLSASSLLYLTGKSEELKYLNFILPMANTWYANSQLCRSDAVIFVREILAGNFQPAVDFCRLNSIPHYYFVDDNFVVLSETYPDWKDYNIPRLRNELASFSGVIVTSEKLKSYFVETGLHENVSVVNPILDESLYSKLKNIRKHAGHTDGVGSRIAYFGGPFRNHHLVADVMPAIESLPGSFSLLVRETSEKYPVTPIDIQFKPASGYFYKFLEDWVKYCADIAVHPHGITSNIDYKSSNAILVSYYMGANIILADEEAYKDFDSSSGVAKAESRMESWSQEIRNLTNKKSALKRFELLEQTCRSMFSEDASASAIKKIQHASQRLTAEELKKRYLSAIAMMPDGKAPLETLIGRDGISEPEKSQLISAQYLEHHRQIADTGGLRSNFEDIYFRGWVNFEGSSNPAKCTIFIDGRKYQQFTADNYRGDLAEAGFGDGRRSFLISIPLTDIASGRSTIDVRLDATDQSLAGFPITLSKMTA